MTRAAAARRSIISYPPSSVFIRFQNSSFRDGVTEPQTSSLVAKSRIQKQMNTDEAG
jgi:hypothetical protein